MRNLSNLHSSMQLTRALFRLERTMNLIQGRGGREGGRGGREGGRGGEGGREGGRKGGRKGGREEGGSEGRGGRERGSEGREGGRREKGGRVVTSRGVLRILHLVFHPTHAIRAHLPDVFRWHVCHEDLCVCLSSIGLVE